LYLEAVMNSFTLDYVIRQKIAATLNFFYMYTLPIPRLTKGNPTFFAIAFQAARLTCTRPEYANLWRAVTGAAWEESFGATDADERQQLRDKIDGMVAHLYGLSRAEYAHILSTFPLVFPDNADGAARRQAVLAAYDALAD